MKLASRPVTGKPSRAYSTAAARSRASGTRPYSPCAAHQLATAPGTVRVAGRTPRGAPPRRPGGADPAGPGAGGGPPASVEIAHAARLCVVDEPERVPA